MASCRLVSLLLGRAETAVAAWPSSHVRQPGTPQTLLGCCLQLHVWLALMASMCLQQPNKQMAASGAAPSRLRTRRPVNYCEGQVPAGPGRVRPGLPTTVLQRSQFASAAASPPAMPNAGLEPPKTGWRLLEPAAAFPPQVRRSSQCPILLIPPPPLPTPKLHLVA